MKKEDFEDAIPVRSQMFKVSTSHHGRVYLPEAFVVREKEGGNVQHRGKLPQTFGYQSEAEMLHEQSEALRQAKQGKEAKELEEIQKAVQTEQIDIDKQREALRDMEEKKKAAAAAAASKLLMQHPSSVSKTSGVNNSPPFGSQTPFPGSHPSSDIPGSAATQAPCVRQHSSREVAHHLYDTTDHVRGQFDTVEAQYSTREYNQGQQQPPSQFINPQSSSHEARRQLGTSTSLAKQQGSPQPFPTLDIGSTIQVSDPPRYGVIRWIGTLQSVQGLFAGIELVSIISYCSYCGFYGVDASSIRELVTSN